MDLGNLKGVDLRTMWANESAHFTPWLATQERMQQLGEALGLELELENTEVPVGPYRADILARDAGSDKYVVIENQIEKTNHDHLGKCITYGTVLDASSIVRIAAEFTDEHRKALDWLNDHTSEELGFYGVVVELWQIDDSLPAPRFNVVSKPAGIVRQASISKNSEPLTDARRLQLEFWSEFRERLKNRPEIPTVPSAHARYWFDVSLGRTGIHLSNVANTSQNFIGIRVYLRNDIADGALAQLQEQREEIEKELGTQLDWNPNPQNRDKIIMLSREADLSAGSRWPEYLEWLVDWNVRFRTVFSPRVRRLSLERGASVDDEQ